MYKVFFNQKLINISARENITLNKSSIQKVDKFSGSDVERWFQDFVRDGASELCLVHPRPDIFFEVFTSAFLKINAAGGVVFNQEKKILFILRNGIWDLPKGKVDAGETKQEAAVREVEEECGISNLKIVKELPPSYHIYRSPLKKTKVKWILKETFWYEMMYGGKFSGVPQKKEGITKIEWFALKELDRITSNTYENLKQIIEYYRL